MSQTLSDTRHSCPTRWSDLTDRSRDRVWDKRLETLALSHPSARPYTPHPHQPHPRFMIRLTASFPSPLVFTLARGFTSATRNLQHGINTRKVTTELEHEGFTPQQAEAVTRIMASALQAGFSQVSSKLVLKDHFDTIASKQDASFASVKHDIITRDNIDFKQITQQQSNLKFEIETLKNDIRFKIAENANKVRADLALEKGRVKQEGTTHTRQIQNAYNLIDQEVTDMKAEIGNVRTVVTQWLIGTLCAAIALGFAYLRLIV